MNIAIVGSHPETWKRVPKLDKSWEIWRFSRRNYEKPPKFHRWFELHHPRNFPRYEHSKPGYIDFLHSDKRVVLQHQFPFDRLLDEFGPFFFSGGQAPWLMAYAITLNPETIGLWGIDPVGDYKPQRSEIHYFISIARFRGIQIIAPEDKILQPRRLYALDKDIGCQEQLEKRMRPEMLKLAIEGNEEQIAEAVGKGKLNSFRL